MQQKDYYLFKCMFKTAWKVFYVSLSLLCCVTMDTNLHHSISGLNPSTEQTTYFTFNLIENNGGLE